MPSGPIVGSLQIAPHRQRHHVSAGRAAARRPKEAVNAFAPCRGASSMRTRTISRKPRGRWGKSPEYVTGPDLNDQVRKGLSISPELKTFMEAM